eukprot:scaffold2522_cov22-Tisochrysis_lutea.AAC.3
MNKFGGRATSIADLDVFLDRRLVDLGHIGEDSVCWELWMRRERVGDELGVFALLACEIRFDGLSLEVRTILAMRDKFLHVLRQRGHIPTEPAIEVGGRNSRAGGEARRGV